MHLPSDQYWPGRQMGLLEDGQISPKSANSRCWHSSSPALLAFKARCLSCLPSRVPKGENVSSTARLSALYKPGANPLVVFLVGASTGDMYDKYGNGTEWVWQKQGK